MTRRRANDAHCQETRAFVLDNEHGKHETPFMIDQGMEEDFRNFLRNFPNAKRSIQRRKRKGRCCLCREFIDKGVADVRFIEQYEYGRPTYRAMHIECWDEFSLKNPGPGSPQLSPSWP